MKLGCQESECIELSTFQNVISSGHLGEFFCPIFRDRGLVHLNERFVNEFVFVDRKKQLLYTFFNHIRLMVLTDCVLYFSTIFKAC